MNANLNNVSIDQLAAFVASLPTEQQTKFTEDLIARNEEKSKRKAVLDSIFTSMQEQGITDEEWLEYREIKVSTSTSNKKEDKKYSVQLDGKTFETSSKQLTKAIIESQEYKNLPEEQKILDTFLRAYSTEYSQDYPFNATYKGNQFYMGMKGTMNAITKKYYAQYLTDNALTGSTDTKLAFKKHVKEANV